MHSCVLNGVVMLAYIDLAMAGMTVSWAIYRSINPAGADDIAPGLLALAFAWAGFAACLFYGLCSGQWRFLLIFVMWQPIRFVLLIAEAVLTWEYLEYNQAFRICFYFVIYFILMTICNVVVIEKCRRIVKAKYVTDIEVWPASSSSAKIEAMEAAFDIPRSNGNSS